MSEVPSVICTMTFGPGLEDWGTISRKTERCSKARITYGITSRTWPPTCVNQTISECGERSRQGKLDGT